MLLQPSTKLFSRTLVLLLSLAAGIALLSSSGTAQKATKQLSQQDVIDLLTGDVSSEDVAQEARKSGISFPVTASVEREIRGAGGTDALINTLRSLAPRAPASPASNPGNTPSGSPAVLMIESSPGQSQVYVDDEPVGSTSQEGRLKLTKLSSGSHSVRISLNGYQDHEETVTLAAGVVTTVAAPLQRTQTPNIAPAPQTPPPQAPPAQEPPTANSGQPGYLGVFPVQQQPAGARGVVISGAAPGGPADQIGLKAYDTILAVDGMMVSTPQALKQTLSSHQAGDTVKITWSNGSTTVTRAVQLVPYPNVGQTAQQQAPGTNPSQRAGVQSFLVGHDHNMNGQNYCVGIMTVGNGMVIYKGMKGNGPIHHFEIPISTIRQAQRNRIYLALIGGFHITLKRGSNLNFVLYNAQGQPQPPDAVLTAIDGVMGR